MEDRDWTILQTLYQLKNITKTAQALYISQPALTNRLRQIEAEFGVQIVNRVQKGVYFTPQGEYIAKYADEMIMRLRQVKEALSNMENQVRGTLRLGVSHFFTKYKLPGILKLFHEQYPDVEFKVITGWSKDIHHAVYNQDVHVGFVRADYNWQGGKHLLFEETMCIVSKQPFDLKDLPSLPRIEYRTDYLLKSLIDNWWSTNYSQQPLIGMEVDQVDTCKEMVVNGLGYGFIPSSILRNNENLWKVDMTNKEGRALERRTWMYYHQESMEINAVRAFVQFVEGLDFQD